MRAMLLGIRCEAAVLLTDVSGCSPVVQEGQVQQVRGWEKLIHCQKIIIIIH